MPNTPEYTDRYSPCPACGLRKANLHQEIANVGMGYAVTCWCGARGRVMPTAAEAVQAWEDLSERCALRIPVTLVTRESISGPVDYIPPASEGTLRKEWTALLTSACKEALVREGIQSIKVDRS